jgi:hypothetical protein
MIRIVIAFNQAGLLQLGLTMGRKIVVTILLACAKFLLNKHESRPEIQKHASQIDLTVVRSLDGEEIRRLQVVSSEEIVLQGVLSVIEKALMKPMEGYSRHDDLC